MEESTPKHLKWLPFLIGLSASIGMYAGYKLQLPKAFKQVHSNSSSTPSGSHQKLYDVLSYLESRYVDSINTAESSDFLIQQLCYALDPYTEYLKKTELNNLRDDIDGIYSGAGLGFKIINDQTYVSNVVTDGPASVTGIETGDIVREINNQVLLSHNTQIDSIIYYVKSNQEKLKINLQKKNEADEKEYEIIKKDISNRSLGASMQLDEKSFYVKINRFSERTYREFMLVVEEYVQNKQLKNLVIDLRDNTGGLLDASADILNQLLTDPNLIMFVTKDKTHKEKKYQTTGKPFFRFGKIYVLINQNTASASEVLAGSLQDLSRATIIGTASFGKATVLELFPLADGSSLEMASARIYLPSGRCIQKSYDRIPDSTLNWLSPFKPDTQSIKFANKILPSGKGIIPDVEVKNIAPSVDPKIAQCADDFVIQNYQDIKELRDKKNSETLIETFILKKLINSSKDKYIIKNKNQIIQEIRYKIIHYFESKDREEIERLQQDPWIQEVKQLLKESLN